jgi:hypothetical protein
MESMTNTYQVSREGGYVNGVHVVTWRVDWPGCSAVFYGPNAEKLAREYAEFRRELSTP